MNWIKIPKENHSLFLSALPPDPRIKTVKLFGGLAAKVNDQMACALFARSVMVRLGPDDLAEALALDGAEPFDPMGRGARDDKVLLPETVLDDLDELRTWIRRAIAFTAALPPKAAANRKPKPKAKPAAKARRATAAPRRER